MFTRKHLSQAIKLALGLTCSISLLSTQAVIAEENEETEELGKITVTGTRLRAADLAEATPVHIITREDLDNSGQLTIADVLNRSTLNSFGSTSESSNNAWMSQAQFSLHGIGADHTLVLINGKRFPGSPTVGGTASNINSVPMAAVDRIEILTDGASAIYGSDATAGVVNIILKKNYEGGQLNIRRGIPTQEGGDEDGWSFVTGISGDKGNLLFSVEQDARDIILDRDRYFLTNDPDDLANAQTLDDIDFFSSNARTVEVGSWWTYLPSCIDNPDMINNGQIFPDPEYAGDEYCVYDFTQFSAQGTSLKRDSAWVSGDYEINENLQFSSSAMLTRIRGEGVAGPVPMRFFIPGDNNNPTYNPIWGRDGVYIRYRFTQLGNREDKFIDNNRNMRASLEGNMELGSKELNWTFNYQYNSTRNERNGRNYVHGPTVEAFAAGTHPMTIEDDQGNEIPLTFNLNGDLDPRLLEQIKTDLNAIDTQVTHQYQFWLRYDIAELDSGSISAFVGFERNEERWSIDSGHQFQIGNVFGGSGGGGNGTRTVDAVYAELYLPILDNLDMQLAARYDSYNDFGNTTNPKVSLRYKPFENLVLRASYNTGFRAPNYETLYSAGSLGFPTATDFVLCQDVLGLADEDVTFEACQGSTFRKQYRTVTMGNETLNAEETDAFNIGVVYNITDDWSVRMDYWDIEITNVIQFFDLQDLINAEFDGSLEGLNIPGGGINRLNNGRIDESLEKTATPTYINGALQDQSGIDFAIRGDISLGEYGGLSTTLLLSHYVDYKFITQAGDEFGGLGANGNPRNRAQWGLNWGYEDHYVNWNINYISSQKETSTSDFDIPSYVDHTLSYMNNLPWNARVTVGITNLSNRDPAFASDGRTYDDFMYNIRGRVTYINYSQDF